MLYCLFPERQGRQSLAYIAIAVMVNAQADFSQVAQ
jgi:hypothetical protein